MLNNDLKNLQKSEAVRRLKKIDYFKDHLENFVKESIIYRTEFDGVEFFLSEEEEEHVSTFENKHNALVFHVIKSQTEFGTLYSLLYVSRHEEEWSTDFNLISDLNEIEAFAYVLNITVPEFSEFGYIRIKNRIGGIIRTA